MIRNDPEAANAASDNLVDVGWNQLGRVLKTQTRSGDEIRILLPPGQRLRHGDVIFEDRGRTILINLLPCEVVVAQPAGPREMGLLALELGNLHWPAQIGDGEIACLEDGPVLAILEKLKMPWSIQSRRFEPSPVSYGAKLGRDFRILRSTSDQRETGAAAFNSLNKA